MHKPLTLLQRLAARAEASDCDCQTDDADLLNEAIAALSAREAEIEKLKEYYEARESVYKTGILNSSDEQIYRLSRARDALKGDAA